MSDVTQLVRAAFDAGVELRFSDGRLRVTGKRSAVESWAPRLRPHRQRLIESLRPPMEPTLIDWKPLAEAYHQHHFGCAICIAAGRGTRYGLRCGTGAALWSAYESAQEGEA